MSGRARLADLPLDDMRLALASAVAAAAVFDGWGEEALAAAAQEHGLSADLATLAFAHDAAGRAVRLPMALIEAWIGSVDAAMAAALPAELLATLPVRERIRRLVRARLDAVRGQEEALRRALAIMAMPQNAGRTLRLGWHSADRMWRLAGDVSADYNHYTKRATLAALYAATLAVFVEDESAGKAETLAFLDRRLEGVMRFEKAKARLLGGALAGGPGSAREHFSVARFLGRLRYPAR